MKYLFVKNISGSRPKTLTASKIGALKKAILLGMLNGKSVAEIPKTAKTFNAFEPMIFAKASEISLFTPATIVVTSSGRPVPAAKITAPANPLERPRIETSSKLPLMAKFDPK